MTDTVAQPGTVALEPPSTVLNPQTISNASGNGTPSLSEGKEDTSPASVMEAELARLKAEDAEADKATKAKAEGAAKDAKDKVDEAEKPDAKKDDGKADKPEPKAEKSRGEDGKFAKAEGDKPAAKAEEGAAEKPATERAGQDDRQSEGRKHSEPPARFLPEARAKWANVPNEVKAEFHRVSQEYEGEITKAKQVSDRYEPIRQFDEIARSNGRELKDSLAKVVEIEQALARNPIAGLEAILREVGPRKADGSHVTLFEVAQHIVQKGPQAFQQMSQAPQQARQTQPEPNKEIQALRAEIQSMRAEQTVLPVVEAFRREHTDFDARSTQIQSILESGVIEKLYGPGLSLEQRLEQAYRMAGGDAPSQSAPEPAPAHSEAENARPVNPDAGTKSVRGAPSDGADTAVDENSTDLRELLRKEMRKIA